MNTTFFIQMANYHKIIQKPMDFGTIKMKLRPGHFNHYNKIEDFLSDIRLVFRNCAKFNPVLIAFLA